METMLSITGCHLVFAVYLFLMVPRCRRKLLHSSSEPGQRALKRLRICAPAVLERAERRRLQAEVKAQVLCGGMHRPCRSADIFFN